MTDSPGYGQFDPQAVKAAARVIAEHSTFIRNIIHYQADNEFLEEDLFQEFFLSLVRRPLPSDTRDVRKYLYRAITNDVIDAIRQRATRRSYLKKYGQIGQISINKSTPEDALAEVEDQTLVFGRVAGQLRKKEAEAVTLRYRDDYSIAEIAREMGVTKRSVSRYLAAGLRRLRQALAID